MFSQTGYVAQVDEDACTGCGKCVPSCHFEAISMDTVNNKAVIDETRCVGCEVCLGICEFGAKSMKKAPDKGEPFFEAVEQAKAG
jgi:ferredoxin